MAFFNHGNQAGQGNPGMQQGQGVPVTGKYRFPLTNAIAAVNDAQGFDYYVQSGEQFERIVMALSIPEHRDGSQATMNFNTQDSDIVSMYAFDIVDVPEGQFARVATLLNLFNDNLHFVRFSIADEGNGDRVDMSFDFLAYPADPHFAQDIQFYGSMFNSIAHKVYAPLSKAAYTPLELEESDVAFIANF